MAQTYQVLLAGGAEQDLRSIHAHAAAIEGDARAAALLDQLGKAIESLATLPERGSVPRELAALGIKKYRQLSSKPYRLIYYVETRRVLILLIADGRREMQALLGRRLLGA